MRIEIVLPIKIVSELNLRENWRVKHARHKKLLNLICIAFLSQRQAITLPCIVTLIRESARSLDEDNLMGAFKSIRDYVADQIIPGRAMGQADHDKRIKWLYMQKKSLPKQHSCRIVIESL